MELFVVNRHGESETNKQDGEKEKLDKVLEKIAKKKLNRQKGREKSKELHEIFAKRKDERFRKKQALAARIPVPSTGKDEFFDENIGGNFDGFEDIKLDETKKVSKDRNKEKAGKLNVTKNVEEKPEETNTVGEESTENQKNGEESKESEETEMKQVDKKKKKRKIDVNLEGFTVLGGEGFNKKAKVKRVLPKWLTNPKVISVDLQNLHTKVSSIKQLDKNIRTKLKESGIKKFFPVQAEVIPWLLQNNNIRNCLQPTDICVSAPTGSGKTLAFVLPVVQALQNHVSKQIRALVILPTQDLALQVFRTFKKFTAGTKIDVSLITGRSSFAQEQKQLISENTAFGYLSKVDILVCTAGRLVDHLKSTPGFTLEHLEFLVIDEADRVLDNVQNDWLYHLEKHIYRDGSTTSGVKVLNLNTQKQQRPPQKLLFSATLSQDPEKLQKLGLFQPKLFTSIVEGMGEEEKSEITDRFIGKYTTPKELTEKFLVCSADLKPLVLYQYIKNENLTKTIVFTHSLESTHRLSLLLRSLLKKEKKIEEIGSNLEAKFRNKLIENFEKGNIDVLVCTDALARGIDLAGVKCVVSYSAPKHLKTYIHRAGRTARAGEEGLAVTLVHKTQLSKFNSLLQQASKTNLQEIKVDEAELEPLVEQYKDALSALKKSIDMEEREDLKKIKSAKRGNNNRNKRKRVKSE